MPALTTEQEQQICGVLEALGAAEFYDSLISGATFAVTNMFGYSDEDALGVIGDLQSRGIIRIEMAASGLLPVDDREPAIPQARLRWRCNTQRPRAGHRDIR